MAGRTREGLIKSDRWLGALYDSQQSDVLATECSGNVRDKDQHGPRWQRKLPGGAEWGLRGLRVAGITERPVGKDPTAK